MLNAPIFTDSGFADLVGYPINFFSDTNIPGVTKN